MIQVDNFIGLSIEECKQDKIQFEIIGEGTKVIEQYPSANTWIEENQKVVLVVV